MANRHIYANLIAINGHTRTDDNSFIWMICSVLPTFHLLLVGNDETKRLHLGIMVFVQKMNAKSNEVINFAGRFLV